MGCEHSKEALLIYPSALVDVDDDILKLWGKFLKGDCRSWKERVERGETGRKPPSVYWYDIFKDMLDKNMHSQRPLIAQELHSRSLKCMAKIMVGIMQVCLQNIMGKKDEHIDKREKVAKIAQRNEQLERIARFHCKWDVDDASYITVENALMESLRICLESDFSATFEVRLRYKYGLVKNKVIEAQKKFEKKFPNEAAELHAEGQSRFKELAYAKVTENGTNSEESTTILNENEKGQKLLQQEDKNELNALDKTIRQSSSLSINCDD